MIFTLEKVFLLSRSTSRASYSTAIPFPARSAKTKESSFSGSQIQHRFVRFDLGRRHHVPNPFFVMMKCRPKKWGGSIPLLCLANLGGRKDALPLLFQKIHKLTACEAEHRKR